MTKKVFHILNGDALKEQFPRQIVGTQIIMRECLVDGPVDGNSLNDFFETRAHFFFQHYNTEKSIYHNISKSEIERIADIPDESAIYLWFEDDLFCQVNFWFVCYLLQNPAYSSKKFLTASSLDIFLVRPPRSYSGHDSIPATSLQYGFGGLNDKQLVAAYKNPHLINEQNLHYFAQLWKAYEAQDEKMLWENYEKLGAEFSFIKPAIQAQIDRRLNSEEMGLPENMLLEVMEELGTQDFKKIFPVFNRRAAIYGFGDLQVKRILDDL